LALCRLRTLGGLNPLSGLPGNTAIYEEITSRLRAGERFACLYLDIDNFKSFNDRYGFTRGDTLISELAEAIFGGVAEFGEDTFLGHIGGDDFIVLSASSAFATAAALAQAAAERKTVAKKQHDGRVAVDRRHAGTGSRAEASFRRS